MAAQTTLYSIQGGKAQPIPMRYLWCRSLQKHDLDGVVTEERANGRKVWVARLECDVCGTWRTDVMTPIKCELISRAYLHPDDYDGSVLPADARKIIYKHMIDNGVSLKSLLS